MMYPVHCQPPLFQATFHFNLPYKKKIQHSNISSFAPTSNNVSQTVKVQYRTAVLYNYLVLDRPYCRDIELKFKFQCKDLPSNVQCEVNKVRHKHSKLILSAPCTLRHKSIYSLGQGSGQCRETEATRNTYVPLLLLDQFLPSTYLAWMEFRNKGILEGTNIMGGIKNLKISFLYLLSHIPNEKQTV